MQGSTLSVLLPLLLFLFLLIGLFQTSDSDTLSPLGNLAVTLSPGTCLLRGASSLSRLESASSRSPHQDSCYWVPKPRNPVAPQ